MKIISFNVWLRYFVWNFKGYLWNSTQNILPMHRKVIFVQHWNFNFFDLRTHMHFWNTPQDTHGYWSVGSYYIPLLFTCRYNDWSDNQLLVVVFPSQAMLTLEQLRGTPLVEAELQSIKVSLEEQQVVTCSAWTVSIWKVYWPDGLSTSKKWWKYYSDLIKLQTGVTLCFCFTGSYAAASLRVLFTR